MGILIKSSRLIWFLLILPINSKFSSKNCIEKNEILMCNSTFPIGNFENITTLKLLKINLQQLDFNYFQKIFPNLINLHIIGSNQTQVSKMRMPEVSLDKIKVLQLSSLQISTFWRNFTDYFPNLQFLNISGNFLSEFPNFSIAEDLKEVYLWENKWNCSKSLKWILKLNQTIFKDLHKLRCFKMPHNNKPILAIAKFQRKINETCTPNCACRLIKCITNLDGILEPIIEVNCSYRNFTQMPSSLPPQTKILRLEGNFIEDLNALNINPIYRGVHSIFLDNNVISSISNLEASYWLSHFRELSLANNLISELPVYALDNALQHNPNMPIAIRLKLGGNPWRCDCLFVPRFKEMLQKYAPHISDIRNVKCSINSEAALLPIVDVSRSSVCHSASEYTIQEALDLLNGVLGFLIIFVLAKLAYDYYNFKKHGRLPWIVTKLP